MDKFIEFCKNHIIELCGVLVVGSAFVGLLIMVLNMDTYDNSCYYAYEYKDSLGQTGVANNCYTSNGNLICTIYNKRISVIEYEHKYFCK